VGGIVTGHFNLYEKSMFQKVERGKNKVGVVEVHVLLRVVLWFCILLVKVVCV